MNLAATFPVALYALLRNKARSLLTTLGIIVLAGASVAGLAQLLGDGHKTTLPGAFTLGHSDRAADEFKPHL